MVRRVRPTPGSQPALFTDWDFHAIVTDRAGDLLQIEAAHRRHAVVEQPIAELNRPVWRTCRRGGSWPTPHGSRSR
ncbi:hypothetical protein [Pseudonocardia sp. 73-21]|uniref:hypothetical protein n=1 Tax=Pseudonocardia sp. 73-21 TaxID=1895809 RepID=UPI0026057406|nr:hypothetical protein [Pseudonocardia sp. 73-21]